MKKLLVAVSIVVLAIAVLQACRYDDTTTEPDKSLYRDALSSGYTYYDAGNLLSPVSPSPHGTFKLRFNTIAQSALDVNGELPQGGSFPPGSVIVKEIFRNGEMVLYAIMKKDPSNPNASGGWLWAELNLNSTPVISVTQKGTGCVPCHAISSNRDLTLTFELH